MMKPNAKSYGMLSVSMLPFLAVGLAHAQDTDLENQDDAAAIEVVDDSAASADIEDVDPEDVIVVRGLRQANRTAISNKRLAEGVIESLSIEDIGKLPEKNIADALQRLAGVTGSNDRARSNEISIRGLGGAFGITTVNGRQIASAWSGRSTNLDVYPSEAIGGAGVAKTAAADHIDGGISGAVNLETLRPLTLGNHTSFKAEMSYNDLAAEARDLDGFGTRYSGIISRKFADDKIGIVLGGSIFSEDNVAERYSIGRYVNCDWDGTQDYFCGSTVPIGEPGWQDSPQVPIPNYSFNSGVVAELQRESVNGSVEWEVNESLTLRVDALYSRFEGKGPVSVFSVNLWDANRPNPGYDPTADWHWYSNADHLSGIHSVVIDEFEGDNVRRLTATGASVERQHARQDYWNETKNYGFNADWESGPWAANFDVSHSSAPSFSVWEVARPNKITGVDAVFDWTTGSGGMPSIHLTSQDPSVDVLSTATLPLERYRQLDMQNSLNEITAVKFDVTRQFDQKFLDSITVGARYAEMTQERDQDGHEVDLSGYGILAGQFSESNPLPTIFSDLGLASYPTGFDYIDPQTVNQWLRENDPDALVNEKDAEDFSKSYKVVEETFAFYAKANVSGNIGAIPFTGQVGARVVKTDGSSSGVEVGEITLTRNDAGAVVAVDINSDAGLIPVSDSNSYTNFLPSASFNFALTDDVQLRLAAAKTILRPDLRKLRATKEVWTWDSEDPANQQPLAGGADGDAPGAAWGSRAIGASGNPYLEPLEATQFDISLEWYPSEGTFFAISPFYKDLDAFYVGGLEKYPYAGAERYFNAFTKDEEAGGKIKGVEIQGQYEFNNLPGLLSNLSVNGNVTLMDIDMRVERHNEDGAWNEEKTSSSLTLPTNMSESSYGVGLYYDDEDKFSASMYLYGSGSFPIEDANGAEFLARSEFVTLSASASYDLTDNFTLTMSGNNLTNETQDNHDVGQRVHGGERDDRTIRRTSIGRTITVGLRAEF